MDEIDPLQYGSPQNDDRYSTQLQVLGILLIVVCGISIPCNIYSIFSVSLQMAAGGPHPPATLTPAGRGGFYFGFYAPLVLGIIAIPALAFMIFSGIALLRRRWFKVAYAGLVLAVIPFTASCLFP